MTPEEFGDYANAKAPDLNKVKSFLMDASDGEIRRFIHRLDILSKPDTFQFARVALEVRLAKDAEKTARWLVWITIGLFILTTVLLAFTIVLHEDARAQIQYEQLQKHSHPTHP